MPSGIYERHVSGNNNPNWKGGRIIEKSGYIRIYCPHHPFKSTGKYIYEHRLIMENHIGRYLKKE